MHKKTFTKDLLHEFNTEKAFTRIEGITVETNKKIIAV